MSKDSKMTPNSAARIQSASTKTTNGSNSSNSFAARAQAAAAKNSKK